MKVKNQVKLGQKEQELLKRLINKGSEKTRKITCCRILLLADEGKTDTWIIGVLKVARNTIRTVRCRFVQEGLEAAINEQPRSGAPKKFSGHQVLTTALVISKPFLRKYMLGPGNGIAVRQLFPSNLKRMMLAKSLTDFIALSKLMLQSTSIIIQGGDRYK